MNFARGNSQAIRSYIQRTNSKDRRSGSGVGSWTHNAAESLIVHGASFANWTADANSFKTATGMFLTQTSTTDNLIIDILGLALSSSYWMAITITRRSPGASGGNVRLVIWDDTGNEIAGPAGALINLHAAGTTGTFYAKVFTKASQAQTGKFRMVLKHATTTPDAQPVVLDGTANTVTLNAHGLLTDEPVRFPSGTLPVELATGTTYYVRNPTANTFQVAATPGGAVIDFTGAGTSVTINNYFFVTDVKVYPIPARSSAKVALLGDRTASYGAAAAGQVDTAILAAAGDNINVVTPGDLSDGTNALGATNDALRNALIAKGGNMYSTPGNWDYAAAAGIAGWQTYFGGLVKTYRSVILGEMEFFFYDNNSNNTDNDINSVGQAQADIMGQWLQTAIRASTAKWKIVVFHYPAYTSSTHHAGAMTEGLAMRWDWASLGVPLVLQSHDHVVEQILVNNTLFYTFALGGGGANAFGSLITGSQYNSLTTGYLRFHDSPTKLVIEHMDINNLLLNRVAITKP